MTPARVSPGAVADPRSSPPSRRSRRACSEKLLTPVNCPELCPGGQIVVYDTVLTPITGEDSTFTGYVAASQSTGFLVSNNLPAADARGFVRFLRRSDTVFVTDTARTYTIDSVTISLTIDSRDSLQDGIFLLLYKLPPTIDSAATFTRTDGGVHPRGVPRHGARCRTPCEREGRRRS